jgi:hypothetical protein
MRHLLSLLTQVATVVGLGTIWTAGGFGLLPREVRRHANRFLVGASALALGAGANAVVLTILAIVHLFRPGAIWATVAMGLAICTPCLARAWSARRRLLPIVRSVDPLDRLGILALGLVLAATLFATLAPPASMDAIIYHLRAPSVFVRTGTWTRLDVVQSFQPMYVEMLFGEGLVLGGGSVAALVHWLLGLGAIATAAAWGRRLGGNAILAAVIFGATGLYVWESTSAFIDLGLALFASLAFFWGTQAETQKEGDGQAVVLAGVFAGLAAGSKFTGLMVGLLAGLAAVAVVWPDWRRGLRRLVVIGGLTIVIASPWYVRNVLLTGNPIYPLANRLFGGPWVAFSTYPYGYGRDLVHLLSSPLDLLARGEVFDQGWSLGPAVLALAPIGILARRSRLALVLGASIGAWWLIWFFSSPQARLLLPVLPMAAGLAGVGAQAIKVGGSKSARLVVGMLLAVTAGGGVAMGALAVKTNARVVGGLETKDEYLERNSWHYLAYEKINQLLPTDAKVASIGLGHNLFYANREVRFLGDVEPPASQLRGAGFTHEIWIGDCPLAALDVGRRSLAEGTYPLRASKLLGGVFSRECYRLSELLPAELGSPP